MMDTATDGSEQDAVPLTRDYMLDEERHSPLQDVEPVPLTIVR